jgi:hypothetical protein
MARLIPRKQIEEQQNISGSLSIRENVFVGNDAIISGSIFVSQSFFFGSATSSKNEITGSVFLTGSLVIDGELRTSAPNTILSVTSSNTILAVDTQRYAGILAKDFGANLPTLYVSSTDGDDTNDGRTIQYPLRTIKRAAALATPGYDGRYGFDTGSRSNGYVIKVQAGTYLEDNPVILPKNTTIWGAGLRITKINAKNPTEDLFYVNSGCYIAEVTMGGLRLFPDQINPVKGFAVAFQPGAFITTSPYVQNCSQISNQENSFTELYEEIPPGGGGLYVNGDVIDPDSPLASMVLDAYTQISPNGVGCLVNGRGFIQLVSFFNNFSYYAIRVNNGGHATLNNSNISFGLYGMYASGSRFISGSGGNIAARDSVRATWSVVVDVLNKGLENGLPTITKLNTDEGIRLTSPALYTQSRVSVGTTLSTTAAEEIAADYKLVSAIVENGTSNFPTLLAKSSNKGYGFESPYNILGAEQITSSISATNTDLTNISGSYAALLSILANGTGSFTFKSNNENAIKVTTTANYPLVPASPLSGSVSSSFGTVINILKNGLSVTPTLIPNNSSSILIGTGSQYFTGVSSSFSVRQSVSASFGIVYGVLQNGTGSNILPIPENHQRVYTIVNSGSIGFKFNDVSNSLNPTLTLFRGETYKFNVDATEDFGGVFYPFWIRTAQIADIGTKYDYNKGVVNNGDSTGTITFTVPYDAPNTLYYVADNNSVMGGKLDIVNSSATPRYLIANTLTYPETILSSSIASTNVDKINAYDLLIGNKELIKDEVVRFVNYSWSDLDYNQETCKRDVGYIIDGVAKDLLYGGNEESLRSALYYYIYPSEATTTQKEPTASAVKYALGLTQKLLSNRTLQAPDNDKLAIAESISDNRLFVQNETIAFLSSSWSGDDGFYYNEEKCKRDVGYILDAVATDALYGGNERAITAARFYYLYPSAATVAGVPSSTAQLEQTLTGIKYAAGVVDGLVKGKTFQTASSTAQAGYDLLKANKELIQNETIEFINVAYPQLKYNQTKCRRDVGYIIDSVATDLLYGGNERGVVSGRNYYAYPSIATSIQRRETIGGVRYAKIIGDFIVQNTILETPRIVNNDEKNIKATALQNVTSSFSGTTTQKSLISSSFSIVEGIIKGGLQAIPSVLAQNTNQNWGVANPLNVTANVQTTNNYVTPNEINAIDRNFGIVTNIIDNGISAEPKLTSSLDALIKVTDISQITGSSATTSETASISSLFAYVMNIISGGLSQLNPITSSLENNIKVTATALVVTTSASGSVSSSISSSMGTIIDVITNGLSKLPALTSSLVANIKVTNTSQTTTSGSLENINFISQSISKVTQIIETGNVDLFGKTNYTSAVNSATVYNTIKDNIPFIQNETIAYLSSSWAGFEYDEVKCKRDIGLIVSGAAEDFLFNSNSASIVNGQFYYEFPSQATDSQLAQTLDGINYASRLTQKIIQNVTFNQVPLNTVNADTLLKNNKVFIQNETIAYMSSSWGSFDYNEATCKRDIGYIIDAVRTDLVYGGNERTRVAAEYYFLYPSDATGSQLLQTTDAISYASRLAQKIVWGQTFTSADSNKVNASNLLSLNKSLIAKEVVAYVSSSWSSVQYNEAKCKRDVGYILDAVRTDLVYGGNERTTIAGEFYYRYPSAATVGGEPTATQQLDPTITGVNYARRLAQNIVLNKTLVSPTQAVLDARELVKNNTTFIQQNTIEYISNTYPTLNYKVDKCFRDVRFIVDGVLTDLVYGGNERSLQSGEFYYKYPSLATGVQSEETIDAINFAKELTKLIAIGGKAIEDGFDIVTNIISSGSAGYPTLVENTLAGIRTTNETQYTSSNSVSTADKAIVSASYGNVINIIDKGISAIPTIVSSTQRGVNITGGTQITSSITPSISNINKVGNEFNIVMNIIENGTGSLPNVFTNASSSIKVTNTPQFISTASISSTYITKANNSFDIVLDIVENGTGSLIPLVKNVNTLVKITNTSQYSSSIAISSSLAKAVTGSFERIISIIENGTGSLPTITLNGYSNVRVTNTPQYISASSATNSQVSAISASFALVSTIVKNGLSSVPTLYSSSASTNANVLVAYNILKNNITFIQDETIAYLSSSWSTASYDEAKCKRDVGLIISGAMEDLLFSANSASAMSGKYYYEYPSQAQYAQLNQTLDGIKYASTLAQKVVVNTPLQTPTTQIQTTYDVLVNNKQFIQNETIAYVSSSWSSVYYNEDKCKRDVGHIVDAIATDVLYGGNERAINAGVFYYLYPSRATVSGVPSEANQLDQTVTGIAYAKDLADKLLRGGIFTKVSQNKLQAKELIQNNKPFIQNEVIAFVSSSWRGFQYNEISCSRDVAYILDGVITDVVYGGNERSRQAGIFYYKHPSQATDVLTQLGPTLTGIRYSKGLTEDILVNSVFESASLDNRTAYQLLVDNKELIQNETIEFVSSSWSMFTYNDVKCRRDVGYMVDAVATDILYGGNERAVEAGRYYYLYPSLAIVEGDGNESGQLDQTLDGIRYAKGIAQKIVANTLLQTPTTSETTAYNLLLDNKQLIQKETIAYLSSSWSGVGGFFYNEASCSRDVAYIIDNVATDLLYGGNERSSKAGEYYYLYPSAATVTSSISPSTDAQKGPTIDGVQYAAGLSQTLISNFELIQPTDYIKSAVSLLKSNRAFIQNETIQYIDAFFPYLTYLREKCRRDVGYIVDGVATDLFYGGNQRSITSGDYYFRYPNKATTSAQLLETVSGIEYAKAISKKVAQNIVLIKPVIKDNTSANIKATDTNQYTSSINVSTTEISKISSSFSIVTNIIENGVEVSPTKVLNTNAAIKVTNETITTSSIAGGSVYADLVTSSFNLVRDIVYYGEAGIPDALARNYDYGFQLQTPTLLHISSTEQSVIAGTNNASDLVDVSASYATVIDIVSNGTGSIPTIIENTSSSINVIGGTIYQAPLAGTNTDITKIANGFEIVKDIIEGTYPTFVSNTTNGVKVTITPQIILSGSTAQRLQAKLVSSSFAVVTNIILNGTGSQTYIAPSATANTNPRITSAYNLLLGNKNMIIDETIAYMSSSWSTFDYTESLCRRDLGYIIDGAASDLLYGGNSGSFLNGQFYAIVPSQATSSQLDQTLTAIKYASGISEKVIENQLLTHISASQSTSASYVSLLENKEFIQNEAIAYVSSSWMEFDYNETTCRRDVGYIVDAVATDLLYGGNERSWTAGDYYFRYPSQATTSQLQPTLDGVNYAKGVAMNVAKNTTFVTADANTQFSYDILLANKEFIQNETVAFVNAKYPNLYYDQIKCKRDVGYIVDAIATDLLYGGNERAAIAGEFYYLYPSLATESEQVVETTAAIDYARRLSIAVIQKTVIPTPQIVLNTFNNIKVSGYNQTTSSLSASAYEVNRISSSFALVENIVENGLGVIPTLVANTSQSIKFTTSNQYITGSEVGTSYEASLISASISIVTNIVANGVGVAGSPVNYTTPSTASNVYYAYNLLKENIGFIQNETIAYISSSWSTSSFNYDESKCKRDVGLIISGALEDMLFGVDSASIVNGKFYFESASQATGTQLNQTLDGLFFASKVAQKVLQNVEYVTASIERRTAWELLNSNKTFIQNETIAYVSSSWVTGSNTDDAFYYDESKCKRDVGYILDAVATDTYYGGNERTITAGKYYFLYPSSATGSQLDETLDGIRYAAQLASKVVVNTLFVTASATASAVYTALKNNKPFIQAETIAFVSSSWSGLAYTESKCRRDVGLIIDAVATDILYGGNQRSATAGQYYFKYPSQATGSQLDSTLNAIDFAGGTAKNVITNTTFVTASQSVSASVELLRNNRLFIQNETMAYLTASWSSFEYNKEKCKRDVGFILDGVATDILYGGNERSVMSGDFYYKYPSKATLLGDGDGVGQLGQTLDGIIYASRIAQKVAQNTQFVTASSAVSASFDLLRKNKNFIAAETIAYVSSSWSGVYYNEASCSRDVKYIIDAAATDVFYGGTERAVTAGSYYFLFPSKATVKGVPSEAAQLDPTITGVRYAGKLASKVVTNPTFVEPSASLLTTVGLLTNNKTLIQKETITFLSSSWSTLKYNEVSCSRDLGFIIDAIRTDLVYGGNERSIEAGSYYYKIPSVAIQPSYTDNGTIGQKLQTVDGIDFARGLSEKVVANTLLTYLAPSTKRRQAAERLRGAKDELKQRAIGYTNGAFPYLVYNEASCSRDTGLIVDACCTDLLYGGNERGIAAASSYYDGQYGSAIAVTRDQLLETLETNRYLRTRAEFVAAGAPVEAFGSLIVATGIDYSYNGSGVTFKALPPNQGGSGVANPLYEITELGGGRIYFTSGNETGDFRIGTGLSINQATGTLVGRTFSKSLFSLVTPFSLALQI